MECLIFFFLTLQGKLIKRFNQQLEAKQRVNPSDHLSDLKHYPCMTKLLTVIGVSLPLAEVSDGFTFEISFLVFDQAYYFC